MTTLVAFDDDLDLAGVTSVVKTGVSVTETVGAVTETVAVTPMMSAARAYLAKPATSWSWADLRDYCIREIEKRHGVQVRDSKREFGIFNSFFVRWGALAVPIAKFAFETNDGVWNGQPIGMSRFTKGSDPYFAAKIAERLAVS